LASDASARLYQAFLADDATRAISVIEQARAAGTSHERLFDQVYAPALAALGASWAAGTVDEYGFTRAAVVADQVSSFVTPAAAAGGGLTVVVAAAEGEIHTAWKAIVAGALTQAGHRVIDLGTDVLPVRVAERVKETRARVVILFTETVDGVTGVRRVRDMLDSSGMASTVLLASGGPFSASPKRATELGAHDVVVSAEGALEAVASVAAADGGRA
jgi:methanogenic corrinoid protein MtbC1